MGYFSFGAYMILQRVFLAVLAAGLTGGASLCQTSGSEATTASQDQGATSTDKGSDKDSNAGSTAGSDANSEAAKTTPRADAYYNFTMGHIDEQQYETTSKPRIRVAGHRVRTKRLTRSIPSLR